MMVHALSLSLAHWFQLNGAVELNLYNLLKKGRECVLTSENAIKTIIQSLHQSNAKVKIHVLEILSAVCFLDKGHAKVLKALDHLKDYSKERARFLVISHSS